MTVRTFKQHAQGFGTEPIGLVAQIDGVVVFDGTVPAVDEPFPSQPDTTDAFDSVLFSWQNTVDFTGTAEMQITVTGPGILLLTSSVANYVAIGNSIPGPDTYGSFYNYLESDTTVSDPFLNPTIDGVEIYRNRNFGTEDQLTGQWWYTLPSGSTFVSTVGITAGIDPSAEEEL